VDLLSIRYAGFVFVAVLLFHVCPPKRRFLFLCAASIALYGSYSPVSAAVLIASTLVVFYAARALERRKDSPARRGILFLSVVGLLLGYLLLIKLLPIFHRQGWGLSTGGILLALGVSYYTFKLLGYLIDIYWTKYPAWSDPIRFLAFAAFFPQLPAGPIQRAYEFEISASGSETSELMRCGLRRILWGAVKKTVVADQLGSYIASIDGLQPQHTSMLWIAACMYTMEMYFDFAALTDISIGTAALFGIRSPENFALPFFAPSISQFWRRWHMTLTFWLTDYVFTPLRMALRNLGKWGLALSLVATMVLIGLWHGIALGFLLFGLVHGVFLIVDSFTASARRRLYRRNPWMDKATNLLGPVCVFAMVTFALVLFRAETTPTIVYQMQHLWDGLWNPVSSLREVYYDFGRAQFGLVCLATFGLLLWEYTRDKRWNLLKRVPRFAAPLRWAAYYASVVTVVSLHLQSTHFIYVQF
jgi:alginate O-acetyltransferase complex protein AlgI